MDCSNGGAVSSEVRRGPHGATAILKLTSEDDHGKNSHACLAQYDLVVAPAANAAPVSTPLLSSDSAWGRKLSGRISGFSADGKRVLGFVREGGKDAIYMLFDFGVTHGRVALVDLKRSLSQLRAVHCGSDFAVAGVSDGGVVVVQPDSADACGQKYRWTVDAKGALHRLPEGQRVAALFAQ